MYSYLSYKDLIASKYRNENFPKDFIEQINQLEKEKTSKLKPTFSHYGITDFQYKFYKNFQLRYYNAKNNFLTSFSSILSIIVTFLIFYLLSALKNYSYKEVSFFWPLLLFVFLYGILFHLIFDLIVKIIRYRLKLQFNSVIGESKDSIELYEKDLNNYNVLISHIEKTQLGLLYEYEKNKKNRLLKQRQFWLDLNGYKFEEEFAGILKDKGYKVKITKKSNDGGIDILVNVNGKIFQYSVKIIFQRLILTTSEHFTELLLIRDIKKEL